MSKFKTYAISILIPIIIGGIVGFITSSSIDYNSLEKPPLSPPSIVFPIVWTILYGLMGLSYGILKFNSQIDSDIKSIYFLQLFVNALWSIFFFTLKWRLFALLWILILLALIIIMTIKFYNKNKIAGIIQIPYILWTIFATYLNFGIVLLNN